jgi:hypothetical protein
MEHPITPPPELIPQWVQNWPHGADFDLHLATQAARWGYQQAVEELGAFLRKGHDKG